MCVIGRESVLPIGCIASTKVNVSNELFRMNSVAHVSPRMASGAAFPRTTLEAPWSSASFAPDAEIILWKIMITMGNGFGCAGCIREKSARSAHKSAAARLPPKGAH